MKLDPLTIESAAERPVVYDDVSPELCSEIAKIVLTMERMSSCTQASNNRGGWKSTFFHNPFEPALAALERSIADRLGVRASDDLISWAMVNRSGAEHPRHWHPGSVLTCVYFVTAGDPATPTYFECSNGTEIAVEPKPGRLAICPGTTWHRVPVYLGTDPRITIITDVR